MLFFFIRSRGEMSLLWKRPPPPKTPQEVRKELETANRRLSAYMEKLEGQVSELRRNAAALAHTNRRRARHELQRCHLHEKNLERVYKFHLRITRQILALDTEIQLQVVADASKRTKDMLEKMVDATTIIDTLDDLEGLYDDIQSIDDVMSQQASLALDDPALEEELNELMLSGAPAAPSTSLSHRPHEDEALHRLEQN